MRLLILADSMDRIKPGSDTSLAFLREFFGRGWDCFWASPSELSWQNASTVVQSHMILNSGAREILPQISSAKKRSIDDFDLVLIRKDPPFDDSYLRMCWLLAAYEKEVCFSNRPSLLIQHHEKMLPMEALIKGYVNEDEIIQSCVSDSVEEAVDFVQSLEGDHLILKPWLGHGGRDIKLLDRKSFLEDPRPHIENQERWIIQKFEEDIFESGDRRVLFIGGKCVGDFVRIPKSGHFVSNLVRGGQAVIRPMSAREKTVTSKLENFLSHLQIDFAGVDFIASKLSEINITSPTGLLSFEDLTGRNLSKDYVDFVTETKFR